MRAGMFSGLPPERAQILFEAAKWISEEMRKKDKEKTGVVAVTPSEIARKAAEAIVDFDLTIEEGLALVYTMGLFSKME
jgi:hypothetical protein